MSDVIDLTRDLVAFDTTNPPGNEAACGAFVAQRLEAAGLAVSLQRFDDDRLNVVARLAGASDVDPLVLTGHLDTVPLGAARWASDPFGGEISRGRLYGRGVSDMKAGVAAMIVAATRVAARGRPHRGVTLVLTSGEETGCTGALELARADRRLLGTASAMLVGEPTGNRVSTGHKGCVAMRAHARGVTAHSSMPHKGDNAIYKAAEAVGRVAAYHPGGDVHPLLGDQTINVGMISGGLNYNSVPDAASFTVDVRSNGSMTHDAIEAALASHLGDGVRLERFVDMPAVRTAETHPFVALVQAVVREVCGRDADVTPFGIPFFSDASVFQGHFDCPTIILGPGESDMAHQTDEYADVAKIEAAVEIYDGIVGRWCADAAASADERLVAPAG